jgi:hypothetical protein
MGGATRLLKKLKLNIGLRSFGSLESDGNSGRRFGADRGVSGAFQRQLNQRIVDDRDLALSRLL